MCIYTTHIYKESERNILINILDRLTHPHNNKHVYIKRERGEGEGEREREK